jgi:hypothetical protein
MEPANQSNRSLKPTLDIMEVSESPFGALEDQEEDSNNLSGSFGTSLLRSFLPSSIEWNIQTHFTSLPMYFDDRICASFPGLHLRFDGDDFFCCSPLPAQRFPRSSYALEL